MANNFARLWYFIGGCLLLGFLIHLIVTQKKDISILIERLFIAKYRVQ